ncbi:beta-lactamase family protein [Polyplosphaeria fusca]|uniref:Beta-lactamase family protein n=1 Tax=Polyplosphaeria fusca TaxID=682080 RepID=A0A9P4QK03_9PLEO|nr:beta-lactamase family protein [Polyplosphaeria fusca]
MEEFEAIFDKATKRGANIVPGATVAVVDKNGTFVYKNVSGSNGVGNDAKPLEFDQTYFIASFTKLVTSVAAMQAVERGLIALDEPLDEHLPELALQPIIRPKEPTTFDLIPAVKAITLRHLLSHSSGAAYDVLNEELILWRQSRGETPSFSMNGNVAKGYAYPRCFEAGEGWRYGTSIDWAGLLVARLNKTSLEDYIQTNIAKPLGIESFTWHPSRKPNVAEKLMAISARAEDGSLAPGPDRIFPEPDYEAGGAGLYSNVHDYTRVLADLLRDNPVTLKKSTVDQIFSTQLQGKALEGLYARDISWKNLVGGLSDGIAANHGLGGFLLQEDVDRDGFFKPKGTMSWSGMPNLFWSINRERGLALMFATQIVPWNDEHAEKLFWTFENAVWRNFSK